MVAAGGLSALARSVLAAADDALGDGPCLIALSGGADSAVCAWAVLGTGRAIRAVSVDHGLAASGSLMEAAAGVAGMLGIDHAIVAAPAPANENALRKARYGALDAAARPEETIVLGHTADDQVETILAHLFRGSGAAGAAGMPQSRGRWLRPLLGVRRDDVRALAVELGLPFADDPGNSDRAFLRNRIRLDVLPLLRRDVDPAVDETLARTARHLAADEALLDRRAGRIPLSSVGAEIRIPAAALATLPDPVGARVVRLALRRVLAPYPGSERDVRHVMRVAAGEVAALPLAAGHLASREGPWVVVHPAVPRPIPDPVELPVPGEVGFGRWVVSAHRGSPSPRPLGRRHAVLGLGDRGSLSIRGTQPGDRIEIRDGTKPVVDALREAGIPARLRPGWPLVEADGRMIWIAGVRAAAGTTPHGSEPVTTLRLGDAS